MKIDKRKVRKILLISLSNIGDIILTTPVFQKLHEVFPEAVIDVTCGPAGKEIFKNHPAVRRLIIHDKHRSLRKRVDNLLEIRHEQYDMVVDLKNTLIPLLAGARYSSSLWGNIRKNRGACHKRYEHLLKLQYMGLRTDDAGFFIPIAPDDITFIDGLAAGTDKKMILINPGAKSHLKRWGALKYARLSDRLIKELGCRVYLAGKDEDCEIVDEVISNVTEEVEDVCGRTSIGALAELMKRTALVITNDSAPLHLASAVGAPTVAIFGPSEDKKYGPLSPKSRTLKPDVPCRPCGKALCRIGPDEGCISKIKVDEVFSAAKELLGSGDQGQGAR